MLNNFVADVKRWAAHPYKEDGNLLDWGLFILIWVCFSILWVSVIKRLVD